MSKFIDNFADWVKPRTMFALLFYATACYLILKQIEIPQFLNTTCSALFGYYFGIKKMKEK